MPFSSAEPRRAFDSHAFAKQGALVHGDAYYYGLVQFVAMDRPVLIMCNIHGQFMQAPDAHFAGGGCPECKKALSSG